MSPAQRALLRQLAADGAYIMDTSTHRHIANKDSRPLQRHPQAHRGTMAALERLGYIGREDTGLRNASNHGARVDALKITDAGRGALADREAS